MFGFQSVVFFTVDLYIVLALFFFPLQDAMELEQKMNAQLESNAFFPDLGKRRGINRVLFGNGRVVTLIKPLSFVLGAVMICSDRYNVGMGFPEHQIM